eukprot:351877-Chlamydomonas_euryale.AAC.4
MDPITAPRAATPQPEAGLDGVGMSQLLWRPRLQPRFASRSSLRWLSRRGHRTRMGDSSTRRASPDSDGDEERDTAQLELDGATTDGGAEKALLTDGAESDGQEPGSEDHDAARTDDGGTDDDAADVQQLTAVVQIIIAQRQARDQHVQRGRL